jgi:anti-sigma factor RsiW
VESPRELTCRELVVLVTEYVEGRLPASDRARFEAHLAGCAGCVAYVAQMRETVTALGTLPTESVSPREWDDLLEAFRSWRVA